MEVIDGSKKYFFMQFLGFLSFVANIFSIYEFISQEVILLYLSAQWFVSIILIIVLFLLGILFLKLGKSEELHEIIITVFGGIYLLVAIFIYLWLGVFVLDMGENLNGFFGILILLTITCLFGFIIIFTYKEDLVKYFSYGFALMNLFYIFFMIFKYLDLEEAFDFYNLFYEIVVMLIGLGLFYFPFKEATE